MHTERRLPLILLASRSPRRRRLLTDAGIEFEPIRPAIDDSGLRAPETLDPEHWVMALAYLKAAAAAPAAMGDERRVVVLGADTLVWKDGRLIGQPTDADDARTIIRSLANGSHRVLTGVALIEPRSGERELRCDSATVHVGDVPEDDVERYVASGEWRGKAGAYNFAERVAEGWPLEVDGDPSTVMGLPVQHLLSWIDTLFRRILSDR